QKSELVESLKNGSLDNILVDLYCDEAKLDYQSARYIAACEKFELLFGSGDINIFSAPGRIEIIGNNTDHQHGKVITAAVNADVIAVVKKTEDDFVRMVSGEKPEIKIDINALDISEEEQKSTTALIKGMLNGLKDMGYNLGGFAAYITSDIPVGSAFASSAAFETLLGNIVSGLFNDMKISPREIAQIGQYSENIYFGKPSGLMDQAACSVGGFVYIDFSNPADPIIEKIDSDLSDYSICITDTKSVSGDQSTEYALIISEMKSVANELGKDFLNDVDKAEFEEKMHSLREKCSGRAILRAMHFFAENERVSLVLEALKNKDTELFIKNENESGNSSFMYLQNVSSPIEYLKQDLPLALAVSENVLEKDEACRIHASGFSGVMEAFVKNENVDKYKARLEEVFPDCLCTVVKIRKAGGIRVI
ncbi:MAG: galactokinase, partial [Lachnospiraceae bacterium]|nr:galactokinase [Lachnospiraceae bacterium]